MPTHLPTQCSTTNILHHEQDHSQFIASKPDVPAPPTSLQLALPASPDELPQLMMAHLALKPAVHPLPVPVLALVVLSQSLRSGCDEVLAHCRFTCWAWLTIDDIGPCSRQTMLLPLRALARPPGCTADVTEFRVADASVCTVSMSIHSLRGKSAIY